MATRTREHPASGSIAEGILSAWDSGATAKDIAADMGQPNARQRVQNVLDRYRAGWRPENLMRRAKQAMGATDDE